MVAGGRVYDREGANNKMPLRHVLMITKQIIEEHTLSDKAAYILFRRALTGQALGYSV